MLGFHSGKLWMQVMHTVQWESYSFWPGKKLWCQHSAFGTVKRNFDCCCFHWRISLLLLIFLFLSFVFSSWLCFKSLCNSWLLLNLTNTITLSKCSAGIFFVVDTHSRNSHSNFCLPRYWYPAIHKVWAVQASPHRPKVPYFLLILRSCLWDQFKKKKINMKFSNFSRGSLSWPGAGELVLWRESEGAS